MTDKLRETAQRALEALELSRIYIQKAIMRAKERGYATDTIRDLNDDLTYHDDTITALRERLGRYTPTDNEGSEP